MLPLQNTANPPNNAAKKIKGGSILLTDKGVLVIDLCGAITAAVMNAITPLIRAAARQGAKSFCLLADKALLTMGDRYLRDLSAGDAGPISGAVVVSEVVAQPWRDYAARLAERGAVRLVFTGRAKALEWAEQQALLAVEQEQWERERCSLPAAAKSARRPGAFADRRQYRRACAPDLAP